jgi:hypothetical protein
MYLKTNINHLVGSPQLTQAQAALMIEHEARIRFQMGMRQNKYCLIGLRAKHLCKPDSAVSLAIPHPAPVIYSYRGGGDK